MCNPARKYRKESDWKMYSLSEIRAYARQFNLSVYEMRTRIVTQSKRYPFHESSYVNTSYIR